MLHRVSLKETRQTAKTNLTFLGGHVKALHLFSRFKRDRLPVRDHNRGGGSHSGKGLLLREPHWVQLWQVFVSNISCFRNMAYFVSMLLWRFLVFCFDFSTIFFQGRPRKKHPRRMEMGRLQVGKCFVAFVIVFVYIFMYLYFIIWKWISVYLGGNS